MKHDPIADPQTIQQVKESFESCLKHPDFFHSFYDRFTKKDSRVADLFKNTDFERQAEALKASLAYLIMFAEGSRIAETKVEDLGIRHDRNHINITPDLYQLWLEALIETIRDHSPTFTKELEKSWTHVLMIGITRIKNMH